MTQTAISTRLKSAAAQAAVKTSEKRRDRTVRMMLVLVVLALVGGIIGTAVWSTMQKTGQEETTTVDINAALPVGVTREQLGATVGAGTAPVLDIYEDFQCPGCRDLEKQLGSTISGLVDQGKIQVHFHPMIFLDDRLENRASLRAAAAFGCAVDAGVGAQYHAIVFANQAAIEGQGYTDGQLLEFAKEAGITGRALTKFSDSFAAKKYQDWARMAQDDASRRGVKGTPTMYLDGRPLNLSDLRTPRDLIDQVQEAGK